MFDNFLSETRTSDPVLLNLSDLPRGVDHYHIDVKLSTRFSQDFEKLLGEYIRQEMSQSKADKGAQKLEETFQENYQDMMTVLIHRIKTDLGPTEVNLLQFAVIRFILERVRNSLDENIRKLRNKLSDMRASSSSKSLVVQEQIFWLNKHYNVIVVNINRRIFTLLKQVEARKLHAIRRQYLEPGDKILLDVMFNPMLFTSNLDSPDFLIETYILWNRNGESSNFPQLNNRVETLISQWLPQLEFTPLLEAIKFEGQMEIYDDLKGLASCYNYLGPSPNTKNFVSEAFTWLDDPGNFEHLFDKDRQQSLITAVRREHGLKAWWQLRKKFRHLNGFLLALKPAIKNIVQLRLLAASDATREMWNPSLSDILDKTSLCSLLAGEIKYKDFVKRYKLDQKLGPATLKEIKDAIKETRRLDENEVLVTLLRCLARYRMHLKFFRFAHRVFNRVNILVDEEKLKLSSQAGTLYQLPMADEVANDELKIAHHTILKADVRGSTTVTDELEKLDLNPASYFSLRFFSPINKVLPDYGAQKVFIEGDAIILSLLEYQHDPQHWLAVARACGLAKAMLAVVSANNAYSSQIGLPPLELGIGICHADCSPRFLYDGDQPIMISSAIGQADRLSSCSWKLRTALKNHPFNVEVMEIAADDQSKGEKGQQHIRYNVNGILLENSAFAKLQNEIELTRINARVAGKSQTFFFGEYPDTQEKLRNLVIREAQVGLWRNDEIVEHESTEVFYEVVTNTQIVAGIQKKIYEDRAAKGLHA